MNHKKTLDMNRRATPLEVNAFWNRLAEHFKQKRQIQIKIAKTSMIMLDKQGETVLQ